MIGMVLGPLAESNLRDALLASGGEASTLVSSPITIVIYLVLIAALLYTGIGRVLARRRQKQTTQEMLSSAKDAVR
jgi:putative tricarboxylic transport membrane protein